MSFWSQTSDPNRRFRTNPRSSSLFARESSPDTDMFFESPGGGFTSNFPRANLAERLGNTVFEDFPRRPMHAFADQPFGSLHRRQHPNWVSSDGSAGSRESSPTLEGRGGGAFPRHSFFHRADSIPVKVTHESRQGSRSSTPESSCSGHSNASSGHSGRQQQSSSTDVPATENGNNNNHDANGPISPEGGGGDHPGVTSKNARTSFTAKRQPKVHHIPILVESRDGAQTVMVTPPATDSPTTNPTFRMGSQQPKKSPPVANEFQKKPNYSKSNVNVPNRTGTPPNTTVSSQNEEESAPMMADPNKPIPAVAPESVLRNGTSTPLPPPPPQPQMAAETTGAATTTTQDDSVKNKQLEAINRVSEDVEKWKENVLKFDGVKGDKEYMFLDEMLTRCLIALDNVFVEGNDELRAARRAVVVAVNNCIRLLEQRAASDEQQAKEEEMKPQVEQTKEDINKSCNTEDMQIEEIVVSNENREFLQDEKKSTEQIAPNSEQREEVEIVEVTV